MSLKSNHRLKPFASDILEAIARVIGDTDRGISGSQIAHVLAQCAIPDTDPTITKWKRIYNALAAFQNQHGAGNHVVVFIQRSLSPVNFVNAPEHHRERCQSINAVLAFAGMQFGDDGQMRRIPVASNLDEALRRSNYLKAELRRRKVHEDVVRFCDAEIIANNAFHAVFEGVKSITSKIRTQSGLTGDGALLVDEAFGFSNEKRPLIAINALVTETHRGEQRGFANLLKGLYGTFRNPLGHEAKIEWLMPDEDALDILSLISLVHRKLDKSTSIIAATSVRNK